MTNGKFTLCPQAVFKTLDVLSNAFSNGPRGFERKFSVGLLTASK